MRRSSKYCRWLVVVALLEAVAVSSAIADGSRPQYEAGQKIDKSGAVYLPPFAVPLSSYMSERAKQTLVERPPFTGLKGFDPAKMTLQQQRDAIDNWYRPQVERAKALYAVDIREEWIAGVRTDVVLPKPGVPARNSGRVLINLHGGSYSYATGGRLAGLAEAIPIAGSAAMKVISVDYKTAPKHRFPAATLDVVAVSRNCSRAPAREYRPLWLLDGATLTANVVAWLQKEKLPKPGAVGLFCGGATKDDQLEGDSYYTASALMGDAVPAPGQSFPALPYLEGTRGDDPLVAPVVSLEVLAGFPPTLLISGTRDLVLSAAVYTHTRLVKAGVDADLHVWDGMWHGFFFDVDLPESKEAYDVVARFFDRHLLKVAFVSQEEEVQYIGD